MVDEQVSVTAPSSQTMLPRTPAGQTVSSVSSLNLLDLPQEVFDLIVKHATNYCDGTIPFSSYPLTLVHPRFQRTINTLITNVDLVTCYDLRLQYKSRQHYTDVASTIMSTCLRRCKRLKHLNIAGCDTLTDTHVGTFLRHAPPLRSFTAVICMTQTDTILDDVSLRAGNVLQEIDLSGCDRFRHGSLFPRQRETTPFHPCRALSDTSLHHLGERCKNLRRISLSKALSITDDGLRALGNLRHLEEVSLRRLTGITNEGISYLADGNGKLRKFSLLSCGTISDAGLHSLAHGRATRNLEAVAVSFNHGVTELGIRGLAKNLSSLEELLCDHCASLRETWCRDVRDISSSLQRMSFRGVSLEITATGITDLCRVAPQLKELNLAYVGTINARLLGVLKDGAPQLCSLVLEACSRVDDSAAEVLADFVSLRRLDVSWCSALTSCGIRTIAMGGLGAVVERLCLGPVNGGDGGAVLYTVGRMCRKLEILELCGEVDEDVVDWLKVNCMGIVEYAEVVLRKGKRRVLSDGAGEGFVTAREESRVTSAGAL